MMRLFQKSDIGRLHELIQTTIEASYPAYYPDQAIQFFKDYHSVSSILKRDQEGELLIIENEGEIVATGSLVNNEISGVFVVPCLQRSGLGKKIMHELEDRAKKAGKVEIELDVSLPSRKFYEDLEYRIVESCQIDVGKGQSLKYWQAKKMLTI